MQSPFLPRRDALRTFRIKSAARRGVLLLAMGIILQTGDFALAQVKGDEAEMDRLQARAEELIATGDPEGAALQMGRAALMAALLAKGGADTPSELVFRGAEQLYRAQEQGYRALALYQRAGGQPPASTGTCHTLHTAETGVHQALTTLAIDEPARAALSPRDAARLTALRTSADDWVTVVASMASDFQCP